MSFLASAALSRAQTLLHDESSARWSLAELTDWLNDGLCAIARMAPQDLSKTVVLDMVEGTYQTLPANAAALLRVNANVTSDSATLTRGRAVTPISRRLLDATVPNWQSSATVPFARDVLHTIDDPEDRTGFLVFPGNNGLGKVEARVSVIPATIAPTGDATLIGSYDVAVDLAAQFRGPLVDYILYRAYGKDAGMPNMAQRSASHYQMFAAAFAQKQMTETAINPETYDGAGSPQQ